MEERLIFKIGDSVKVKANVKDPDFDINIGGWQGRVSEIIEDYDLICVKWDSLTLGNMSSSLINECEAEGFDWIEMNLDTSELEIAEPRDTEKDVKKKIEEIEKRHPFSFLGEQGKRFQKVLQNVDLDDDWETMEAWGDHLENVLKFSFEAEVSEAQDYGALDFGDRVKVEEITHVDDLYGVIVKIRKGRKIYHFPLCDLEVRNKKSSNYQHVDDYAVWFANR